MANCNRKCLSDPYSSCYIFGKFTTKNRQRKITDFVKRSYLTCFGYHNVFICVREKFTVPVKLWSIFFQLYWIRSVKYWFATELYILEKNLISSVHPPHLFWAFYILGVIFIRSDNILYLKLSGTTFDKIFKTNLN